MGHSSAFSFDWIFFIFAGKQDSYKILDEFKFRPDSTPDCEVSCHECLKKIPLTYNGENLVSTLEPSFLIGSSSFLQVIKTTIKAWMHLNFSGIPTLTADLAAHEFLKNRRISKLSL